MKWIWQLPKEWDACRMETGFKGILRGKVCSTSMKCVRKWNGRAVARIKIRFAPGFWLFNRRIQACWNQIRNLTLDGFGGVYDGCRIPGVPDEYTLSI